MTGRFLDPLPHKKRKAGPPKHVLVGGIATSGVCAGIGLGHLMHPSTQHGACKLIRDGAAAGRPFSTQRCT
jgi:hypothetical protein